MSSFWLKFIICTRKWVFHILYYFIVTLELSPKNLAIILDGHRTFSQRYHISPSEAYMRGVENTLQIIRLCKSLGTESITFFLFSQHNWKRDAKTTQIIFEQMTIFLEKLAQNTVSYRYKILGEYTKMPANIRQICDKLIDETKNNDGTAIILAINYSSRMEMINIAERALKHGSISNEKETPVDVIDDTKIVCDLLIRTSGQKRLSDYLLLETARGLLYFTDECWPEFSNWSLFKAIMYYQLHLNRTERIPSVIV